MAVSGIKLNLPKESIITALTESKGVISRTALRLDVSEVYLRKRIKEFPDVEQLLEDLRFNYETKLLDMAEDCVVTAMSRQDSDPNNALKSAFFVLNSRGQERGYSNTLADQSKNQKIVFEVNYPNATNSQDSVKILPEIVSNPDS